MHRVRTAKLHPVFCTLFFYLKTIPNGPSSLQYNSSNAIIAVMYTKDNTSTIRILWIVFPIGFFSFFSYSHSHSCPAPFFSAHDVHIASSNLLFSITPASVGRFQHNSPHTGQCIFSHPGFPSGVWTTKGIHNHPPLSVTFLGCILTLFLTARTLLSPYPRICTLLLPSYRMAEHIF